MLFRKYYQETLFLFCLFHIMENILNILIIFKLLKQLFDGSTLFFCHIFCIVRNTFKLSTFYLKAIFLKILLYITERFKLTVQYNFLSISLKLIYSIVYKFQFKIFQRNTLFCFNLEHTFMVKKE